MNIRKSFFVSDLHGRKNRYDKLFNAVFNEMPEAVFIGGDLLPSGISVITDDDVNGDFFKDYLKPELMTLKEKMKHSYPAIFVIAGNDDPRIYEKEFREIDDLGLWHYINEKTVNFLGYTIIGYNFVPPTPFLLKDWEKYDVSRYVDVGCVSPEEGFRSVKIESNIIRFSTIAEDLNLMCINMDFTKTICLFHSPPYNTNLDRINTDGKMINYVKPDEHVGSIAIKKFIEFHQPLLTLHGHIHESTSITNHWQERIGNTLCLNAATNKHSLSLIRFSITDNKVLAECEVI